MKNKKLIVGIVGVLVLVAVVLAIVLPQLKPAETSKGKLIMATNASFPPYEFYQGTEIVGIDVEIAKAIADKKDIRFSVKMRLGWENKEEWRPVKFLKINGLSIKKINFIEALFKINIKFWQLGIKKKYHREKNITFI